MHDKIMKAKVSMILDKNTAFFSSLMLRRRFVVNNKIDGADTDGKVIYYNEKFLDTITIPETVTVICHLLVHTFLGHNLRRGNRNVRLWNIACDYAVNIILDDANMKLPTLPGKQVYLNNRYRNMSAEDIYSILHKEEEEEKQRQEEEKKKQEQKRKEEEEQRKKQKKQDDDDDEKDDDDDSDDDSEDDDSNDNSGGKSKKSNKKSDDKKKKNKSDEADENNDDENDEDEENESDEKGDDENDEDNDKDQSGDESDESDENDDKDGEDQDGDGTGDNGDGNGDEDGGSNDPGGLGGVSDAPLHNMDESSIKEEEAMIRQEVAQAMAIAKQQGNVPGNLEAIIGDVIAPVENWHERLARFIYERAKNDYSFLRPSTRFTGRGVIMPSLYNMEVGNIVLFLDTSGSITYYRNLLNRFAGEVGEIAAMMQTPIRCLHIDTHVRHEQTFEPNDDVKIEPKGGGGTDFRPGFDLLEEEGIEPACVIYFTDGESYSFPEEPPYPVLWAKYGNHDFKPPFGEVIEIPEIENE